ncbi:hypothetical protein [Lentzea guizhouensis]|nr:hypothetical protein [Lentzea guizhouensis]
MTAASNGSSSGAPRMDSSTNLVTPDFTATGTNSASSDGLSGGTT